jgi:hypothetical protein
MADVWYHAWLVDALRPQAAANMTSHTQPKIERWTKVTVVEELWIHGVNWLRIEPPAEYKTDRLYPECWVPNTAVTARGDPSPKED